jgi:adenine phosphoribosyltransferase
MAFDLSRLADLVRPIPDYPEPGVTFRDITPLLADSAAFRQVVDAICDHYPNIDKVVGVEARGFIIAAAVAYKAEAAFVPVRKAGKLPWAVVREDYSLEYGSDRLEMHRDAVFPGERVLVVDDVLATGGTATATVNLIEALGGVVDGLAFMIEIPSLHGRARLGNHQVQSLLKY